MAMTTAGVGLFLLVWAWLRSQSFLTIVLAVFGVALLGSGGVLDRITHAVVGAVAAILNGLGSAL